MKTKVEIVVPREFIAWRDGFERLPDDAATEGVRQLRVATDLFFSKTQQFVHVLSGDLKASGDSAVVREGDEVHGEVEYTEPYAQIEEDRGGEHAYMSRGWEAAADAYETAMGRVWSEVVGGWQ